MNEYEGLVIGGLLLYIAFTGHDIKKQLKELKKNYDSGSWLIRGVGS